MNASICFISLFSIFKTLNSLHSHLVFEDLASQGRLFWSQFPWPWIHRATCRCHTEILLLTHHLFFLVLPRFLLSSRKFFKQLGDANTWSPLGSTFLFHIRKPNLITQSYLEYFFFSMPTLIMLAIFELENSSVFSHTWWT